MYCLSPINTISMRRLLWRAPIVEQSGVAPHQGDGQPLEESAGGGGLLLPSVPSKSTTQSLDLNNGTGVPGTKALHCQGEKDNALSVAGFPRFVKLSLMGNRKGMTRGGGSLGDNRVLEGVDHRNVNGRVLAA